MGLGAGHSGSCQDTCKNACTRILASFDNVKVCAKSHIASQGMYLTVLLGDLYTCSVFHKQTFLSELRFPEVGAQQHIPTGP